MYIPHLFLPISRSFSGNLKCILRIYFRFMQAEEDRIRRRWKKVSYADSTTDAVASHSTHHQTHRVVAEDGVRDDFGMSGTPLEGALLERFVELLS